ncbi:hypothetical protein HUG15_15640 [Salicibibacter cibarius]|uniref:DUF1640 domain-containing protein n=1 Tax=Salicibibacter cibarius TaxID=2743000 RepID=A0A7T6Z4W6_9BACI|nr:hypothetical protein [Salicibibacter cibarius]QQK76853.1 hypothetical protein HUG15_15640 [Salicibibacter cibarius]
MSLTNEQLLDAIRELQTEMTGMRTELREEISGARSELREEIFGVRSELRGDISGVRSEVQSFRTEVNDRFDAVEKKQDGMRERLVHVAEDVTTIKGTIEHHESDIRSLYKRSFDLKEKIEPGQLGSAEK